MGIILAKREDERNEFNQSRARASTYLKKSLPPYVENLELLGLSPEDIDNQGEVEVGKFEEDSDAGDGEERDEDDVDSPAPSPTAQAQSPDDPRTRAQQRILEQHRQLLQAAANGYKWKTLQISRKHHIRVNHTDRYGRTALFLAAERGHDKVVEMLLNGSATYRPKVDKANHDGWTPLAASVFHGQVACMDLLIQAMADVNVQDKHGCTPLVFASSSPKLYLVDLVSKRDRKKRERMRREAFRRQHALERHLGTMTTSSDSSLTDAVAPKSSAFNSVDPFTLWKFYPNRIELIVLERLLSRPKIKVDRADNHRRTPLVYAGKYGRIYALSRLLDAKANLHHKDKDGKSTLHHAACSDHLETVELLLRAGGSVNSTDEYFRTPLHGALDNCDEGMANLLLKAEASVNAYDCEGRTPIMLAMEQQNQRLFSQIIEHRSNLDVLDKRGWNVVIYSIETGMFGEVLPLLKKLAERARPVIRNRDPQGRNCLHHAAQLADVNTSNKTVEQLVLLDYEAAAIGDCNGDTAIHFAAELGRLEALRVLIARFEVADFQNNRRETPLHYAAHGGHLACVVALLEDRGYGLGAYCDAGAVDLEGKTFLIHACVSGHLDLVNLIIQNKEGQHRSLMFPQLDVNVRDISGCTALSIAAREGQWQLLPSLMLAGANAAAKDNDGFTAMHWAAVEDEALVASCLLDLGLDTDARDARGWTPLMHAVARGCDDVVRVLVDAGADLNARNWDGDTVNHICARRSDPKEVVQVTKDILADGILDSGPKPTGCIPAQGHFMVSVLQASDLYLEGHVGELNTYVCLIFRTQAKTTPVVAFTSCTLRDPRPEWHEVFRFDTELLDTSACLVAWVLAAPGTTADEIVQGAQLGLGEEEIQEMAFQERLGKKTKVSKPADFTSALQDSFNKMMKRADHEQDLEIKKLRKLELTRSRGAAPTSDLQTLENKDTISLHEKRWNEVANLRAMLERSGLDLPEPLAPQSHLPLGCVLVRFRHLRSAVWGTEPVAFTRTLRLNCRGNLKLEIDFRPRFFVAQVQSEAMLSREDDDVYDLRPMELTEEEEFELERACEQPKPEEDMVRIIPVEEIVDENGLMVRPESRRDPMELFRKFRQVTHWSHQVLEIRKQLGPEIPLPEPTDKRERDRKKKALEDMEDQANASFITRAYKQAALRYKSAKERRLLKQQIMDRPVTADPVESEAPARAQATAKSSQPGPHAVEHKIKMPQLEPEPWLQELLDGSRFT